MKPEANVTRIEVIDETGAVSERPYVKLNVAVELDYQDDGRTLKVFVMPRGHKKAGDGPRAGAVKARSQIKNSVTGTWTKRDDKTGKFVDVKCDPKPFKGVRKTKGV